MYNVCISYFTFSFCLRMHWRVLPACLAGYPTSLKLKRDPMHCDEFSLPYFLVCLKANLERVPELKPAV